MGRRFKIHNYIVDPNRNEISHDGKLTSVHKKAMSVLEVLAQANGKVVKSEDIMDSVWPESVVAPNSLQRCILQIRKALNDNGKSQNIIKTHPKMGYSINSPVTWLDDETELSPIAETKQSNPAFWHIRTILAGATILAVMVLTVLYLTRGFLKPPAPSLEFSQVRPLTATDEKEINPKYSPDGRLIIFHRYGEEQEHHLWALDLASSQEYRLTKKPKRYGTIGWSPAGNQLTFAVHSIAPGDKANERCWEIHTLDLYAAMQGPIDSVVRTPCQTEELRIARWVDNNRLSVILNEPMPDKNALVTFDIATNSFIEIFTSDSGQIYSYDYSPVTQTFALVSRTIENEHYIESVNLAGVLQSSALIKRSHNDSKHEYYNLNYHPNGKQLSTHTEEGIHRVSLDGELEKVNTLTHRPLMHPYFHPTQNKMLAVQNRMDQDIALMSLNKQQTETHTKETEINTIARSNELDANGKFQPGTDNIAFISNRSGMNQLWLKTGDMVQPITDSTNGVQHIDFAWSPNGESIAVVMSDTLHLVAANSKGKQDIKEVSTPFSTYSVMQWTSPTSLLVMAKQNNQSAIYSIAEIHSDSPDFEHLHMPEFNAKWAAVHYEKQGQNPAVKMIYLAEDDELWVYDQRTRGSTQITHHDTSKTLAYHQGSVYGINEIQQVWRFEVDSGELRTLKTVAPDIRYISDIRNNQMLVTRTHSHHMEIVEFQ